MRRNGYSLIELLAALAISGIVLSIIVSILISGIKTGESTEEEITLQQEANLVATKLRKEYLALKKNEALTIIVDSNQISLKRENVIDHSVISQAILENGNIKYSGEIFYNGETKITGQSVSISRGEPVNVLIIFEHKDSGKTYELMTTLSRGV